MKKVYEIKTTEKWSVFCQYNVTANSLEDAKQQVKDRDIPYVNYEVLEDEIVTIEEDK